MQDQQHPDNQQNIHNSQQRNSQESQRSLNAEKRQSSLRSLKELQSKKKTASIMSSQNPHQSFHNQPYDNKLNHSVVYQDLNSLGSGQNPSHQKIQHFDSQLNNSMPDAMPPNYQRILGQRKQENQQHSIDLAKIQGVQYAQTAKNYTVQRQVEDQHQIQYKSLLENSLKSQKRGLQTDREKLLESEMGIHQNESVSQSQILPQMINQEASQKSQLIEQALKTGGSLLRKRSPSQEILRRKSTPATPKQRSDGMTVPQALDHSSYQLIQMAQNRNVMNLQTVHANQTDIKFFPSLSQTPKFDRVGGIKVLAQTNDPNLLQYPNLKAQLNQSMQAVSPNLAGPQGATGTQDMRKQRIRLGSKNGSRSFLASESKSQSRIKQRQGMPGGQAWEKANANMFQVRDAPPMVVLQQLQEITSQKLGLSTLKPSDLDSTEPLDSFLDSLYVIVDNYVMSYNEQVKNKLQHLATGIHTTQCEDIMNYVCQLQYRNKVLNDSVEYFADHIIKLQELEQLKLANEASIGTLRMEKEDIFLQRVDIDRKYTEALQFIDQQKRKNQDLNKQVKNLTMKLEKKTEECESLIFRLKNAQDLENMLDPPLISQTIPNDVNGQSSPAEIDVSPSRQSSVSLANDRVRGLEAINKKLETELSLMRTALERDQESKFQENVSHLVKIQDLFNKVQIENKTLRTNNTKLESKLESKEKLVTHLENKVTSVIVEKEEIIIKLKSEIVILKNLIEMNEKKFDERIQTEQEKVHKRLQAEFKNKIKSLEIDKEDLERENGNIQERISSLQEEYDKLNQEHGQYKDKSIEREQELQDVLADLESKLGDANKLYEDTSRDLQSRIENLENVISVQAKQISIQDLKLKFIRESTDNLMKQKNFLVDDLNRSRTQLQEEGVQLQIRVNETNPSSQDYLISAKKALSQSKQMLNIGLQALNNIAQITQFLKIEELLQMIIDQDGPSAMIKQGGLSLMPHIYQTPNAQIQKQEPRMIGGEARQTSREEVEILNHQIVNERIQKHDLSHENLAQTQLHNTVDAKEQYNHLEQSHTSYIQPVNGLVINKFLGGEDPQISDQIAKRDETFFLVYCPIELSSILIKSISDFFNIAFTGLSQQRELPITFQKLQQYATEKSDLSVEQEILSKFLFTTKQQIEERIQSLVADNNNLKSQIENISQKQRQQRRPSHRLQIDNNLLQPVVKQKTSNFRSRAGDGASMSFMDEDEEYNSSSQNTVSPKGDIKAKRLQHIQQLSGASRGSGLHRRQSFDVSLRNSYNVNVSAPLKSNRGQNIDQGLNQQDANQIKEASQEDSEFSKHRSVSPNLKDSKLLQNLGKASGLLIGTQDSVIDSNNQAIETSSRITKRSARKQKLDALQIAQNEIEQLKVSLQEQKQRSKDLQLQLASKIITLEEQLDELRAEHKKQNVSLEDSHKKEIEATKSGAQQREQQLIDRLQHYKHRLKEQKFSSLSMHREIAQLKESMLLIQENIKGFDQQLEFKDEEHLRYQENVQQYVTLRTSQRNIFSIAFESTNNNMSMINEPMLKYYLNKCLKLDKDKFRFLKIEEQRYDIETPQRSVMKSSSEQVLVNKLIIEIIDDQQNFDEYFKMLKNQIRDGSCLLYDLDPLYISINLGQTGLSSNQILSDYHIIFKKGVQIQGQEFLLTILRHSKNALSFKIIAMNFCNSTTGTSQCEEYLLDLSERDLLEITEGQGSLILREQEPVSLVNMIVNNLVIISKDQGQRVLACEHKVFFNSLFHENSSRLSNLGKQQFSHNQKNIKFDNYTQGMNSNNYRNLYQRDEQLKSQLSGQTQNSKSLVIQTAIGKIDPLYQSQLRKDCEIQVNITKQNLVHVNDQMITAYQENQRVGKHLEFKITIHQAKETKCMQISFEEIRSKRKIQIVFVQQQNDGVQDEGYMIHTEVLKISETHSVLISMEKVQKDGLFIKMHNLKDLESKEFFLVKKSNQAYSKLERHAGLDLIQREDFRSFVYDLTFATNIPSKDVLMANVAFQQEQHYIRSLDYSSSTGENQTDSILESIITPPQRKRTGEAQVIQASEVAKKGVTFKNLISKSYQGQNVNSVLFQKQEKGGLLYRNIYVVRCIFENEKEIEQSSIISFFQKRDVVSVEVFLYKDALKMSIASQVSIDDLFGTESHSILSFSQQVQMLDQMMERLYVLCENSTYHLKVENDAVPISLVLEKKKFQQASSADSSHIAMKTAEKIIVENRCREIQSHRDFTLSEHKSTHCHSFILLNGKYHNFNVYYLNKQDKESNGYHPSTRKKNSILKKMFERQTTNLDALIEDTLDYDTIYVEVIDQDTKQTFATVLTQKSLSNLIQQNPYEYKNTIGLISNKSKAQLAEFLKLHTRFDADGNSISIENKFNEIEYLNSHYRHHFGGMYIKREDKLSSSGNYSQIGGFNSQRANNPLSPEIEQYLDRKLVMNQEIDMSEFTYDLKLYLITESQEGHDELVVSYSFEMFALNDPDIIYIYNQPAQRRIQNLSVPAIFGLDVVNLIENPIKQQEVAINMLLDDDASKKQNFQDLFARYIDNRLIITVSEVAFPWKLNYCIIEPCSRLTWTFSLDTQSLAQIKNQENLISQAMGNLEILSSQEFEKFLALNLGSLIHHENDQLSFLPIQQFEAQEGRWQDLGDNESRYEIITDKKIADTFSLTIAKVGKDSIEAKLRPIPNTNQETSSIEDKAQSASHKNQTNNPDFINPQGSTFSKKLSPSNGAFDHSIPEETIMVVNTINQIKIQSQVVKVSNVGPSVQNFQQNEFASHLRGHLESNRQQLFNNMAVQLQVGVKEEDLFVQLINIETKEILYIYRYRDLTHQMYQTSQPIDTAVISGLRAIFSPQIVDRSIQSFTQMIKKRDTLAAQRQEEVQLTQGFQDSSSKDDAKKLTGGGNDLSIVLHRKTFFDDTQEKLIIVSVEIQAPFKFKRSMKSDSDGTYQVEQECEKPIQQVFLKISEPETDSSLMPKQLSHNANQLERNSYGYTDERSDTKLRQEEENFYLMNHKRLFELELRNCFHEEELRGVDLKNISHLKKLARLLIEERAVINRIQENSSSQSTTIQQRNLGQYRVDINFNGLNSPLADKRVGGMSSINEDSPDSSSATGVISGSGATSNLEMQQQLQDQRRALESLRKANNVSANGQRRHHDKAGQIIEEEHEHEEEDEKNETGKLFQNDGKEKKESKHGLEHLGSHTLLNSSANNNLQGLTSTQKLSQSAYKQQHQILEQSVIEEEGSQEENDDTPHKHENDEAQRNSAFENSIQNQSSEAKSGKDHSIKTPHTNQKNPQISKENAQGIINQNSHKSILVQHDPHQSPLELHKNFMPKSADQSGEDVEQLQENEESDSLMHLVEKQLPKDYILEVGVKQSENKSHRAFVAFKKSPSGRSIIRQIELSEREVKDMLKIREIEDGNIDQVVDDLSDLIADQGLLN